MIPINESNLCAWLIFAPKTKIKRNIINNKSAQNKKAPNLYPSRIPPAVNTTPVANMTPKTDIAP